MPPNTQQQNADPYGFIMNSSPKPPRKPLLNGSSMAVRIAVLAGGILLLIIIAIVVLSLLGQGQKAQIQKMTDVISAQSEIIRISALAEKDVRSTSTLDYAKTTRLSVQSSQNTLSAQLKNKGISDKELARIRTAAKNDKTDKALEASKANSRYDETYMTIINESLANYQKLLLSAAGGASATEKQTLRIAYEGVSTLLKNDPKATPRNTNIVIDKSKPSNLKSTIIDNNLSDNTSE